MGFAARERFVRGVAEWGVPGSFSSGPRASFGVDRDGRPGERRPLGGLRQRDDTDCNFGLHAPPLGHHESGRHTRGCATSAAA